MPETITDFVCTACGCMCDDLTLMVEGRRVARVEPPCPVANAFFLQNRPDLPAAALVAGQPTGVDAALTRAAELLQAARAPLVTGLHHATVDAQRAAVALADRLGAVIDPTDRRGRSRNHVAVQTLGAVTATLGEVAARSDLIVYWNCDPAVTHPRHIERIARHRHTAPGDPPLQRRMIVVAPGRNQSTKLADDALELKPGGDLAALAAVRAMIDGLEMDPADVERQTGAPLAQWAYLAERLKFARYAVVFHGETEPDAAGPDAVGQSIVQLVRDHHRHTRAVVLQLGDPGNAVGAAQVLTWQTGFPAAVSFAGGYPRHLPGELTAATLLERGEVDAALIIAADPLAHVSREAQERLHAIPTIVLDDHVSETARHAAVVLFTAAFGVETSGSVYRSDGVSLPLRSAIPPNRPAAEELLQRLLALLKNEPRMNAD